MDYREISQLAGNPAQVRATATFVLRRLEGELTDTSERFLSELCDYTGEKRLSVRALEYLYSLREKTWRRSKIGGYRADDLIQKTWEARLDLVDYEEEEWLDELKAQGREIALSKSQWRRLIRLAKSIELIPSDLWIELK